MRGENTAEVYLLKKPENEVNSHFLGKIVANVFKLLRKTIS